MEAEEMTGFKSLMRRADHTRRTEIDDIKRDWWTGYIRGLRRAHHGENFGTAAEHDLYLSAIDSQSEQRIALGRGYRAGLTLEWSTPEIE